MNVNNDLIKNNDFIINIDQLESISLEPISLEPIPIEHLPTHDNFWSKTSHFVKNIFSRFTTSLIPTNESISEKDSQNCQLIQEDKIITNPEKKEQDSPSELPLISFKDLEYIVSRTVSYQMKNGQELRVVFDKGEPHYIISDEVYDPRPIYHRISQVAFASLLILTAISYTFDGESSITQWLMSPLTPSMDALLKLIPFLPPLSVPPLLSSISYLTQQLEGGSHLGKNLLSFVTSYVAPFSTLLFAGITAKKIGKLINFYSRGDVAKVKKEILPSGLKVKHIHHYIKSAKNKISEVFSRGIESSDNNPSQVKNKKSKESHLTTLLEKKVLALHGQNDQELDLVFKLIADDGDVKSLLQLNNENLDEMKDMGLGDVDEEDEDEDSGKKVKSFAARALSLTVSLGSMAALAAFTLERLYANEGKEDTASIISLSILAALLKDSLRSYHPYIVYPLLSTGLLTSIPLSLLNNNPLTRFLRLLSSMALVQTATKDFSKDLKGLNLGKAKDLKPPKWWLHWKKGIKLTLQDYLGSEPKFPSKLGYLKDCDGKFEYSMNDVTTIKMGIKQRNYKGNYYQINEKGKSKSIEPSKLKEMNLARMEPVKPYFITQVSLFALSFIASAGLSVGIAKYQQDHYNPSQMTVVQGDGLIPTLFAKVSGVLGKFMTKSWPIFPLMMGGSSLIVGSSILQNGLEDDNSIKNMFASKTLDSLNAILISTLSKPPKEISMGKIKRGFFISKKVEKKLAKSCKGKKEETNDGVIHNV